MWDLNKSNLRYAQLVGYAELMRGNLNATGIWIQEHARESGKVVWQYCTDPVTPETLLRGSPDQIQGFTLLSLNSDHGLVTVLWYNLTGSLQTEHHQRQQIATTLERFAVTNPKPAAPRPPRDASHAAPEDRLSPTERRIFQHLRTSKTETEIAQALQRSHHTVHVHVKSIYRKLAVNSRAELQRLHAHRA